MHTALSLLALLVPLPQAPAAPAAPNDVAAAAAPSAELARALDAVQAAGIRTDLTFIASDELAGRDTPSEGLRMAARYIRARLERLGWQPAGDDGDFLAAYRLERTQPDLQRARAVLVKDGVERALVFGEDYVFSPRDAADLETAGAVVFVGKGTEEDLAGLDLAGKWAFAVQGAGREERTLRRVRETNVEGAGAVGLITCYDPAGEDDLEPARMLAWFERGGGRLQLPASDAVFPTLAVTKGAAAAFGLGGHLPKPGTVLAEGFRDVRALSADSESFDVENVVGLWPGSDPVIGREVILVSAHYDHVGARDGEIWNGADDNGSGTCGLLALAEALRRYGPMRRSVALIWVSGEEKGLLGSAAWTKKPTLPAGFRPVLNLNVDMIGRNAPDYLLITPTQEHEAYNALTRLAERAAPLEGFGPLGSADAYWNRSDHANFARNLGIPVAFLFSDVHDDYHRPTDTVEKVDCDKVRRVVRLVMRMLDGLQADRLDL